MKELPKTYDPSDFEARLYKNWLDKGYFVAHIDEKKEPFTIVMPPPNITGYLHMGHAIDNTLQDIIVRWKRMQGYNVLWLPGTDHASIATEVKIVEQLREEGLSKYDLGREKFLERAWKWKEKYGGRILEQLKRLGSSCDWTRVRFTMDERCSRAVREVFYRLYKKGLIYRGDRIINWCPDCNTALSDAEVEYEEEKGHLWHIRYPFKDGSGYVTVATTRPETMLGDTAVAVHPDDERYKGLIGKVLILPIVGREIPLISDEYVEKEFGTGAVKITPAHDPNDFEVGLRHGLEAIKVIDDNGRMTEITGQFAGMDRYEARKKIIEILEHEGYLVKVEDHVHNVGHCYRCHTVVEPLVSKQWFVSMKPLAEPALEVVKNGQVKFVPERFSKIYINWLENIKDWCISRQLWWGHRIPAWYCDVCGHTTVSIDDPKACENCGSQDIHQDEDVLDTWFSSALWPFSTLGWPENTDDLRYFYPTNVLVTGYDIIFFWVARMIFMGLEFMGKPPFEYVFIHGLVRDEQGRKMSKSLGNGIDPIDVIDKYGADTLRFTLATNNSPGNDMRFSYERVEASRNFANKLWNASRFVLLNIGERSVNIPDLNKVSIIDRWILHRYNQLVLEVTENLEKFELGIAAQKLYSFIWDEYCDWYIELSKVNIGYNDERAEVTKDVLRYVLDNTLRLLHPFMPFITEEIWLTIPHEGETIMKSSWPVYDDKLVFEKDADAVGILMNVIREIRNIKAQVNVSPAKKVNVVIDADEEVSILLNKCKDYIVKLANVSDIIFSNKAPEKAMTAVFEGGNIYIPLEDLVDVAQELERLNKELAGVEKEIARSEKLLSNQGFLSKAPKNVIEAEKEKYEKYKEMWRNLKERISELGI
ncbi:valyl-tRNA synthetase [Caldanaerobius fijiensis DSM 17918]|uniref:Valine--tRNA ligase n=1 Tax=Caldanaerobius fijiensis DSM 17918 TaxID=1121256 RepID=A0A1M4ST08_9THEO|nr:valine--tRNA ligase [Caldanaerobius fijiensis]SHE35318.1 valyl-tRNA synthetase [Caldanaerobius fijiensis DSM 17918]